MYALPNTPSIACAILQHFLYGFGSFMSSCQHDGTAQEILGAFSGWQGLVELGENQREPHDGPPTSDVSEGLRHTSSSLGWTDSYK